VFGMGTGVTPPV